MSDPKFFDTSTASAASTQVFWAKRIGIRVVASTAVPRDEVWLTNGKGDGVIAKVAPPESQTPEDP